MEEPSHVGFTVAGAVCANSLLYHLFPHPLPNEWDRVVHALGHPYTYLDIVSLVHHPLQLVSSGHPIDLFHKASFYVLLIWAATLPDRWERRKPGEVVEEQVVGWEGDTEAHMSEPPPSQQVWAHRGFTHSLVLWMLLAASFGLIYMIAMAYMHLYHVVVADWMIEEGGLFGLVLLVAIFFHTIADLFTVKGVSVLWPDTTHYGFGPRKWRFKNKSWREYAVVYGTLIATTILFTRGVVGI